MVGLHRNWQEAFMSNWLTRAISFFRNPFTYRQRQREWEDRFNQPPANPTNPLPLDPGRDPWRT
tara:strand:- start:1028 stop:1219 length:192 start_codon:yes stop_codon:yes gene_type:complete